MKRAPIVIGGTIAGLAGVLAFHTTPGKLAIAGVQTPPAVSRRPPEAAPALAAAVSRHRGRARNPAAGRSTRAAPPGQAAGSRSAVGSAVNYNFGVLSVRVTVSGHKIVKVGIASLDDGGNPRSQFIDQQSIPILEQQVMQAQSASIQGVSGASYTSAGFEQSLQAALHSLGF